MKTLVIHPKDPTTDFLKPIYQALPDTTVVEGGVFKDEIIDLILQHDRVIMLGHGTPSGLLAVGRFPGDPPPWNIIDHTMVPYLRQTENIFIWCNADQFVKHHKLNGLYSGMFISENRDCDTESSSSASGRLYSIWFNPIRYLIYDSVSQSLFLLKYTLRSSLPLIRSI